MRFSPLLLMICILAVAATTTLAQRFEAVTDRPDVPVALPGCGHMPDMYRDNCNRSKLKDHFKAHLDYPQGARDRAAQGNVEVIVQIDTLGKVTATRLIRKGDADLDAEALRLVGKLSEGKKTWTPAMNGDRKVISEYLITVPFLLEQPDIRRIGPAAPEEKADK